MSKDRTLSRDVEAVQIPSGDRITLPAGSKVFITQTLGGSFTVMTDTGLARVDGKHGDALGEQVIDNAVSASALPNGAPNPEAI